MKVLTETGSVYEIDAQNKQARRLQGVAAPTSRTGQDGVWKRYERLLLFPSRDARSSLVIDWTGLGNTTMTSRIERLHLSDGSSVTDRASMFEALSAEVLSDNAMFIDVLK